MYASSTAAAAADTSGCSKEEPSESETQAIIDLIDGTVEVDSDDDNVPTDGTDELSAAAVGIRMHDPTSAVGAAAEHTNTADEMVIETPHSMFAKMVAHPTIFPRHASMTAQTGRDMVVVDGDSIVASAFRVRTFPEYGDIASPAETPSTRWTPLEEFQSLAAIHDIERLFLGFIENGHQFRVCFVESARDHWSADRVVARDLVQHHIKTRLGESVALDVICVSDMDRSAGDRDVSLPIFRSYQEYLLLQRASFMMVDFLWDEDDYTGAPFTQGLRTHVAAVAASCLDANIPVVDMVGDDGGILLLSQGEWKSYFVRVPYLPGIRKACTYIMRLACRWLHRSSTALKSENKASRTLDDGDVCDAAMLIAGRQATLASTSSAACAMQATSGRTTNPAEFGVVASAVAASSLLVASEYASGGIAWTALAHMAAMTIAGVTPCQIRAQTLISDISNRDGQAPPTTMGELPRLCEFATALGHSAGHVMRLNLDNGSICWDVTDAIDIRMMRAVTVAVEPDGMAIEASNNDNNVEAIFRDGSYELLVSRLSIALFGTTADGMRTDEQETAVSTLSLAIKWVFGKVCGSEDGRRSWIAAVGRLLASNNNRGTSVGGGAVRVTAADARGGGSGDAQWGVLLDGSECALTRRAFGIEEKQQSVNVNAGPSATALPTFNVDYHYHTGQTLLNLGDALRKEERATLFGDSRGPIAKKWEFKSVQKIATYARNRAETLQMEAGGKAKTIVSMGVGSGASFASTAIGSAPKLLQIAGRLRQAKEELDKFEENPEQTLRHLGRSGTVRIPRALPAYPQDWEDDQMRGLRGAKEKDRVRRAAEIAEIKSEWRGLCMRGILAVARVHAMRMGLYVDDGNAGGSRLQSHSVGGDANGSGSDTDGSGGDIARLADTLDCGWRLLAQLRKLTHMEPTKEEMSPSTRLGRRVVKCLLRPLYVATGILSVFRRFVSLVEREVTRFCKLVSMDLEKSARKGIRGGSNELEEGERAADEAEFQLKHMPERLLRTPGVRDARTSFRPDEWQVRLLNAVDEGRSCLAVAPTSSGKTFICYYAMERVLRESDTGIVVYVAPTKQLVSQVYDEVLARFSKTYRGKSEGTAVVGTFTRDYRHHERTCQILVTVPSCAEIMFLSSDTKVLGSGWAERVRYIIMDEVHNIGEDDGAVWERLILLANCPIIALSATIGNASAFLSWLEYAQETKGRVQMDDGVRVVKGPRGKRDATPTTDAADSRPGWNDSDDEGDAEWMLSRLGGPEKTELGQSPLDDDTDKGPRKSAAASNKGKKLPEKHGKGHNSASIPPPTDALRMTATEGRQGGSAVASSLVEMIEHSERFNDLSFSVWDSTADATVRFNPLCAVSVRALRNTGKVPRALPLLTPEATLELHAIVEMAITNALSASVAEHAHVGTPGHLRCQRLSAAQKLLEDLRPANHFPDAANPISMQDAHVYSKAVVEVVVNLSQTDFDVAEAVMSALSAPSERALNEARAMWGLTDIAVGLRNAIPGAIAALQREQLLPGIVFHLSQNGCTKMALACSAALREKQESINLARKESDRAEALALVEKKNTAMGIRDRAAEQGDARASGEYTNKVEECIRALNAIASRKYLRQEATLFAGESRFDAPTVDELREALRDDSLTEESVFADDLLDALRRGIACHHATLGTRYRMAVESLFRAKKLRIVFATGTLAQGVHMPCRTVVIAGDSNFLHSLSFAQMTGRAGRRGLDTRGNVVLFNLSKEKIAQVIGGDFPSIAGNRVLTVATVLRLLVRAFQGGDERIDGVAAELRRLVDGSIVAHARPSFKPIARRFVLYALDHLRREGIVNADSISPYNIAGLVTHLHYLEPGCILVGVLMQDSAFLQSLDAVSERISALATAAYKENRRLETVPREATELVLGALSTVIGVVPIRKSQVESLAKRKPGTFLSRVALVATRDLPPAFVETAAQYNRGALGLLVAHLKAHVGERADSATGDLETDSTDSADWRRLPLSEGSRVPREDEHQGKRAQSNSFPTGTVSPHAGIVGRLATNANKVILRNPYWAMRGLGDDFSSADELRTTARSDLHTVLLDAPAFAVGAVNSYALDFLRHGQKGRIQTENMLQDALAYKLLDEFLLGLTAAAVALFKNTDAVVANHFMVTKGMRASVDPLSLCVLVDDGAAFLKKMWPDDRLEPGMLMQLNVVRVLVADSRKFKERMEMFNVRGRSK